MNDIEVWKPVVGYEGYYEVSSLGRVKSVERKVRHSPNREKVIRGRILKSTFDKDGYILQPLWKDNRQEMCKVHHLVLSAFKGCRPYGLECCHKDGNRANNHIGNLEWGTHKQNEHDKLVHNTRYSKLTDQDIRQIRQLLTSCMKQTEIARQFGVGSSHISRIKYNRQWKHLQREVDLVGA